MFCLNLSKEMGMTLDELYERMSGAEIDERLGLAVINSPEFQEKLKREAEEERMKNMSPEEQAALFEKLFNPQGKK
jgi:hypothetical protein